MKYTREERLDIGRQIYDGELTRYKAAERDYMRLYRDSNNLPPKSHRTCGVTTISSEPPKGMDDLESMTKDELILELVKARITEARLKKGYEVKGDGSVILYDSKNIR